MAALIADTKNAYFYYCIYGVQLMVAVGVIVYLLYTKKQGRMKTLAYYGIAALILAMCPVVIWIELKAWMASDRYYKIYYLVPIAVMVGVVVTEAICTAKNAKEKGLVVGTFLLIAIAMIGYDLRTDAFEISSNIYGISQKSKALADALLGCQKESWVIAVPKAAQSEMSEYTTELRVLGNVCTDGNEELMDSIIQCEDQGATCIVLESEYNKKDVMEKIGYTFVMQEGDYYIYSYEEF